MFRYREIEREREIGLTLPIRLSTTWECVRCTLLNDAGAHTQIHRCIDIYREREREEIDDIGMSLLSTTWECTRCTLHNGAGDHR